MKWRELFYVRKRLYRRVMLGFYGTMAISFLILFLAGRQGQESFTVVTFLYPVIAMFYIMHSTPYDATLGAIDSRALQEELVKCVSEKNVHGIIALCEENGIDPLLADELIALIAVGGCADRAMPAVRDVCERLGCADAAQELCEALSVFENSAYQQKIQILIKQKI